MKARLNRPADWTDQRKAPPRADDSDLREAISKIVHKRANYFTWRSGLMITILITHTVHLGTYRLSSLGRNKR